MSERQIKKNCNDKDKKVRGPNIPDAWKTYIIHQAIKESYKPRMLLSDEILEQMMQSRDVRDKLPERESIAKIISRTRKHPKSPLDEPWHVVTLADYDMPAEALPALLLIWGKSQEEPDEPLTIREAMWVARLYRLINNIEFLYVYAKHYALEEEVAEIEGALPPSAANVFFDALGVGGLGPAMEHLLSHWMGGLPDLEMMAKSIYWRPPKGAEAAVKRAIIEHREMMAIVVKAAGLPKTFLTGL